MSTKLYLTLLVLSLFFPFCSAQKVNDNDTQAYEQYLSNTFAQYYSLSALQRVYKYLYTYQKEDPKGKDRYFLVDKSNGGGDIVLWEPADKEVELPIATYLIGKDQGYSTSRRHYDDRAFPDSIRLILKSRYARFRRHYHRKSVAQKELIEALKAFDRTAHNKPLFFADTHKAYNNDIEAYVKDMFKTSILIDNRQNQRFLRKPSAEKLQNDAGVRFVIGVALYKLWLTQQVEDNKSHK